MKPIRLIRGFLTVGAWTLLSRIAGFARDVLLAAYLGTGVVAEAYLVAFSLPNMFRRFFAEGAFNTAFVPLFSKKLEAGEDARRFAEDAFSGLAFVVMIITGISMMVTAQGADHTTGNAFKYECSGKDIDELVGVSMDMQTVCATADSLGLCVFGRSVTNVNTELVVKLINDAMGTELPHEFFFELGRETLRLEAQFNRDAGFTEDDDELPEFFYREPLSPSDKVARFHAAEVNAAVRRWWAQHVA